VPRRIPIRIKLAAALAVPICALLVVAALEVVQATTERADIQEQTELAEASAGPGGIITAIQNERNFGSVYLLGFESVVELPVESYDEATGATDAAIGAFQDEIEAKGGDLAETFGPTLDALGPQLDELRSTFNGYEGPRNVDNQEVSTPFFDDYTALIDSLFQASGQVPLAIDDPTLRRGVELGDLATRHIENMARLSRVLLLAGISNGLDESVEVADAAGLVGQLETTLDQVHDIGVGEYAPPLRKAEEEFAASRSLEIAHAALETSDIDVNEWMASLSREDDEGFNGFRTTAYDLIGERSDQLQSEADQRAIRYALLGLLALIVAGLATWLVSRSITRPLRSLTRQAKDMADRRLPEAVTDILETPLGEDVTVPHVEPVRVRTRDEVSDVAEALNTVQDSALDLAVEQAVLRRNIADSFVNLGRRNQNLLGRQLDFITELESHETEPDALANLFRLDHLATRMRRNAESLLVLAGIEPPRQWAAPVRLTDVIRAALGEVEDYQRVTVRGVEPATIIGSAAADLAHLLAELIENALVFSPPDQTVDIRGRNRPEGYTLAIIDSGLGMPAGDVVAANRRLAGAESFTIAPSKYLGHYVAGNLAARHDIHVHLDNSPGNGITATVDLPPTLLTTDTDLAAPISPPHGTRAISGPAATIGHGAGSPAGAGGPAPAALGLPAAFGRPDEPASAAPADSPWAGLDAVPPAPVLDPVAGTSGSTPVVPPATPSRTASGLVKRSRRGGEQAPAAAMPDPDLLASLSSVTNNLGTRSPHVLPPVSPPPAAPPGAVPPAVRRDLPGAPAGGTTPARSWPAPPGMMPGNGGSERPPLPSRRSGDGDRPPARGSVPGLGDTGPGATESGLARRVRGAQLPNTQPLSLRRNQETQTASPSGYRLGDTDHADGDMLGNRNTNGRGNGREPRSLADGPDSRGDHESAAARSVYGFLTSFTQGVQRGLEEARRDPTTPKENP
jgi:signal transduction histidine kinase